MNPIGKGVLAAFGLFAFAFVSLVGVPTQGASAEHITVPSGATRVAICHNVPNNPHVIVIDVAGLSGHFHGDHAGDSIVAWIGSGGRILSVVGNCPPGGNGPIIDVPGLGPVIFVPGFFLPFEFELDISNKLNNVNSNTNVSSNVNNNVNTNTQNQTNNQNTNVSTGDVNVVSTGGTGIGKSH